VVAHYHKKLGKHYHWTEEDLHSTFKFTPMLAEEWDEALTKGKVTYPVAVQGKLDGMRACTPRHTLTSRGNKPIVSCPHVMEALAELFEEYPDLILDGELYNHEFRDDFGDLMSILRKQKPTAADLALSRKTAQFHVYDMMDSAGFLHRDEKLRTILPVFEGDYQPIVRVPIIMCNNEQEVRAAYERLMDMGFEGAIIRDLNTGYEQKRSWSLLKLKEFEDTEFDTLRIEEGKGNWARHAKRVVFRLPDDWRHPEAAGKECGGGIKGKKPAMKKLLADAPALVGGQVKIRFFKPTPDGMPRFPVAVDFYPGKRED
jgi:DNA ligase 1